MERVVQYIGILIVVIGLFVALYLLLPHTTSTGSTTSQSSSISTISTTLTSSIPTTSLTTTILNTSPKAKNITNSYAYIANLGNFRVGGGTISVINTSTNKVIATIPGGMSVSQMLFKPNSSYAFALTQSGISGYHNVSVIDTLNNMFMMNITLGGLNSITASGMTLSPNGKFLYVLSPQCTSAETVNGKTIQFNNPSEVQIVNLSRYLLVKTLAVGSCSTNIAFTPDSKYAYVANYNSSVSVINTSSMAVVSTIQMQNLHPIQLIITPNGNGIYVVSQGPQGTTLSLINTSSNLIAKNITLSSGASSVSFIGGINQANKLMYINNYNSNSISIVNTTTNLLVNTIQLNVEPDTILFSPNGKTAYVLCIPGIISVMNLSTNKITAQINIQSGSYGMNLTLDGGFLYIANGNSTGVVTVINTTTNKIIDTINVGINPSYIGVVKLQASKNDTFLSNYVPLTPPITLLPSFNVTSGPLTVVLEQLSAPNANGTSAAQFLIYNKGILTNNTAIFPNRITHINSNGYPFLIYVNQTVHGLYIYQQWASVQLYQNVSH